MISWLHKNCHTECKEDYKKSQAVIEIKNKELAAANSMIKILQDKISKSEWQKQCDSKMFEREAAKWKEILEERDKEIEELKKQLINRSMKKHIKYEEEK